jgi:hypothetical protein
VQRAWLGPISRAISAGSLSTTRQSGVTIGRLDTERMQGASLSPAGTGGEREGPSCSERSDAFLNRHTLE